MVITVSSFFFTSTVSSLFTKYSKLTKHSGSILWTILFLKGNNMYLAMDMNTVKLNERSIYFLKMCQLTALCSVTLIRDFGRNMSL